MKRRVLVVIVLVVGVGVAPAWWVKGHESITAAAASQLPDDVPNFFRSGGKHLAHFAGDPDRWKNRECKTLRASIEADHYLDLEDLDGKPLPLESRFKGMDLMRELKKEPNKVGLLPYAIMEGYEKLACAFYDYRQEPDNESIRMKCLVYGGNLAHFTTDASMPLHTTIHFDGRVVLGEQAKKQRGIHAKIDAFPEKFGFQAEEIRRSLKANDVSDVWKHIMAFLAESYTHVDRCYELDLAKGFETPTDASRQFIMERCRAGAQFTLDIWLAAWKRSASLPAHY
jgi:hypothetical protein